MINGHKKTHTSITEVVLNVLEAEKMYEVVVKPPKPHGA